MKNRPMNKARVTIQNVDESTRRTIEAVLGEGWQTHTAVCYEGGALSTEQLVSLREIANGIPDDKRDAVTGIRVKELR
jgi:hypothetical protein